MNSLNITNAHRAYEILKKKLSHHFQPKLGIILGSGLSHLSDHIKDKMSIDYQDLPGFPVSHVYGHVNKLILGYLAGVPVVCLQGRTHYYEGFNHDAVKTYVRTLKLLGCTYMLATNASGSLNSEVGPGSLMLITDHINMQGTNPLIGPNDDEFGPRFYPLDKAYDPYLQEKMLEVAFEQQIKLHQGVYISVLGPHYETAAEIRAFKTLGADAVGMSTVPEVLVANHCGLKVAVIATITNYATGLTTISHKHEDVVATANQATEQLYRLVKNFVQII